ncbi:type VII secretion protein EssC [Peribacillus muralis]|uniref:type VII secretion protein EssC n=1 Tax=Peribacillus muralis TaxID=264697 RepID=UPI001F4E0A39|nr:type VII secretion protein EssC [Peribacillus muralis]MCK1994972.1 type VII secretion protein EssC [Peribacillus muralis]MCK2015482.1 type VII secretion protein EssC [Peribacillus muralis]
MSLLWIYTKETFQAYTVKSEHNRPIKIGPTKKDAITIHSMSFEQGPIELRKRDGRDEYEVYGGETKLGDIKPLQSFTFHKGEDTVDIFNLAGELEESLYYIGNLKEVTVSNKTEATFLKEGSFSSDGLSMLLLQGQWFLFPDETSKVFLNGERVVAKAPVQNGDLIFLPNMTLRLIEGDLLMIHSAESFATTLPKVKKPISEMKKSYPQYRRTPRMIYELPNEKVKISFPSQESEDNNRGLWLILMPPLMMLIVMGVITIVQPRGIFIIISIVMFTTTLVTSTAQYIKDKKKQKFRDEKRHRVYTRYLEQKREELQELSEKQRNVLFYHYPSFERMKQLTESISDRIWERTLESEDALHFKIGTATIPSSYEVSVNSNDMSNREIDDLLEQSQELVDVYKNLEDLPLSIDLSHGSMGLVGKESIVKRELQQLIGQLAFFHSYHDVRFVAIFPENDYREWEWMKWLPHFQLPHAYAKGFIYNEQSRDQLLTSIYQLLRERDLDENKGKVRFTPHFVFIVTDRQLIAEHVILEYLEGKADDLGISTIFAADAKESLTENVHTLVKYINDRQGEILIQQSKAVHTPFTLDVHAKAGNERYARMLRSLDHQKGMNNSIPETVSFLELLRAREVAELPISKNWLTNQSSKSLAVPIGLKGRNDRVELNLHEKAHGPHGLVAGTTGSGKSELLQTYILSLAVHYHPHEVAFLLIDYKGGGMAQPFRQIPHLLGVITNIEGSRNFSTRALASINSELKKRQRLFDRYEVNHINDYTDLYKEGKAEEPLPHLFLISDEFAELKNEEPDFIRELVSTARIGRSLGVHLILATQKPGGVIDNQIWSNARFKISLKVQDANDSKEILKNSDAANITVTGRGYLQVGNNEVYELFQSAWSGAPYLEDTAGAEDEVALVTDLGLVQISSVSEQAVNQRTEKISEIEAVADHIVKTQAEMKIEKLASPWLPPLQARLSRSSERSETRNQFHIGMKDEPELQSQTNYSYNWIEDGNIGIFGSSGYGKSTSVLTLLFSFADQFTPEELHYYLFDFGNSALLPLRQLPHTGDYFRFDELRKIEKFMLFMKAEIERRKQLFSHKELSNIKLYNALAEEKLPIIYITVDNFDLVKDEMPDQEAQLIQFARDGQSLGIFMILTATRINAVRQPLMNSLKTKVVHYLMDSSEQYSVLGRTPYENEPVPGRALVKKDQTYLVQMYLPADGADDIAVLADMKQAVAEHKDTYRESPKPPAIPMLPKHLDVSSFKDYWSQAIKKDSIPIGLSEESVTPVCVELNVDPFLLVLGQSRKGKTNVLKVLLDSLLTQQTGEIGLFDGIDRGLSSYASTEKVRYVETKDQITGWLDHITEIFEARERHYLAALEMKPMTQPESEAIVFVIDSFSRFQQTIDGRIQDRIGGMMKQYGHLGFRLIVAGNANDFTKGYDSLTTELKQVRQAILLLKKSDQSLYTLSYSRKEEEIQPGYGYFIQNGQESKIQIPLSEQKRRVHESV